MPTSQYWCYGKVKVDYDVFEGLMQDEDLGHVVNKTLATVAGYLLMVWQRGIAIYLTPSPVPAPPLLPVSKLGASAMVWR